MRTSSFDMVASPRVAMWEQTASMSRAPTVRYKLRAAASGSTASTTPARRALRADDGAAGFWLRRHVVSGIVGIVLGSSIGGALAWRSVVTEARVTVTDAQRSGAHGPASSQPPSAQASSPTDPAVASLASPSAAPPPSTSSAPADRHAALVVQIRDLLVRFLSWSDEHPGARCPDPAALGAAALDPWGRALRIVCSDQPPDQIAGALSFGPDGVPGTRDDVASWTLGPEVTDLVRGPRWGSTRRLRPSARPRHRPPDQASHPTQPTVPGAPHATAPVATSGTGPGTVPAGVPDASPRPDPKPPVGAGSGSSKPEGDGIPDRR